MNPDVYSAEYQQLVYRKAREQAQAEAHRAALHRKAVARRKKAKRGVKR